MSKLKRNVDLMNEFQNNDNSLILMMNSQTFVLKMSFICMGMKPFAYQWLWNRGLSVATQKCRPI